MQALRAWAAQVGHTINSGRYTDAKLQTLMTAALGKTMKNLAGPDVGTRYPGPLPFTPLSVEVKSSTLRTVPLCMIAEGFGLDPKTGKPAHAFAKAAVTAAATKVNGHWVVSQYNTASFSCSKVIVAKETFS